MIIVSNTGPIIGLAKIGHLHLVQALAAQTFIPPAVHRELLGKAGPEASMIDQALSEFLLVKTPGTVGAQVEEVLRGIDEGESQAVRLAAGLSGSLLLMDDRVGRHAARKLGQRVAGTCGLLLLAKQKGLVAGVSPLMESLRAHGYWISDEIVAIARRLANE